MLLPCHLCRLHISSRDRSGDIPLEEQMLDGHAWEERRNDNEDLLVLYGICKNYEALVVRNLFTSWCYGQLDAVCDCVPGF